MFVLEDHTKEIICLGVVIPTCNPSTQESETGGLQVWGQPGLQKEIFKNYLEYSIKNKKIACNKDRKAWIIEKGLTSI
jgi:hypothetical protein